MESLRQMTRYLWGLHLILLLLGSFFAADLVNVIVGGRLEASTPSALTARSPVPLLSSTPEDETAIIEGNIFNSRLRGKRLEPVPAAEAEMPPAEMNVTLVGTITGGDVSYAILEDNLTHEQFLYRIHDEVGEGRLIEIKRDEAVLRIGRTLQTLRSSLEEVKEVRPASLPASLPPTPGIQRSTPGKWLLEKRLLQGELDNLPQLLTKARIIPNFSGGKTDGFRILGIVPGSFYTQIGLENQDVIQRINGIDVKDPESFLRVFQQLKDESHIRVDLVRNNRHETFEYEIR